MKYIIHRGITSKNIKENSYMAIKKALKDKESIGVEFDIRLTKDHKIVLSHNSIANLNVIEETTYNDLIKNSKLFLKLNFLFSYENKSVSLIYIYIYNFYFKCNDLC